ncbi:hypothetical protein [Streptomyces sp. G1]|uniref:hypothetical protein n=1 Tax=Streptomyces sp. G1 TaxID=361572 RepID=UPI002030C416|nr:hypothetical protein [Streptomyces sp. G1]MCM1972125.1 hypothetical protein [Streptomyces sp. G1]
MSARTTRTATALVAAFGIAATMVAAAPGSLAATAAANACDVAAVTDLADAARVQVDTFGALKDLRVDVRAPGTTKVLATAQGFESTPRPDFGVRHRSAVLPALAALGRYALDVRYTDAAGKAVTCADSGELRYLPHPVITLDPATTPVSLDKPTATVTGKLTLRNPRTRAETPLKGRTVTVAFASWLGARVPVVAGSDGRFSASFTYTPEHTSMDMTAEAAGAAPVAAQLPVEKRKVVIALDTPSSVAPGYESSFRISGNFFYRGGDGELHPLTGADPTSQGDTCEGSSCGKITWFEGGRTFVWDRYTQHGDTELVVTHDPGVLLDGVTRASVKVKVDRTVAFWGLKATKDPKGRLTIRGSKRLGYGTNTQYDVYRIQHSADGKTGWKTYKSPSLPRTGGILQTLEPGTFPEGGTWRIHFEGAKGLEPVTSPTFTAGTP